MWKQPVSTGDVYKRQCEHKERYQHVLDLLSDNGYAAVIFDLRGHGESIRHPKDLGYFYDDSGVWIINDIHQVVHCMKKRFGDLPYIIFGHSMGSLAVRCYLRRFDYEVDGAVTVSYTHLDVYKRQPRSSTLSILAQFQP